MTDDEKRLANEATSKLLAMIGDPDRDQEMMHCYADEILVEFVRSIGHANVAEAFEKASNEIGFWYS
jgi:hypothetical protein